MEYLERGEIIQALEHGWGEYPKQFHNLSHQDQLEHLRRQGYARLGDLLAHVTAWWELGREKLEQKMAGVNTPPAGVDVDEFNAAAVQRAAGLSEDEILAYFHQQREALLKLVQEMPEEMIAQASIQRRLRGLITDHLEEHRLP